MQYGLALKMRDHWHPLCEEARIFPM